MRKRIAERKRKNVLRLGGEIEFEGWIREPGWKRHDCGYHVVFNFKGWNISAAGYDELDAYHLALDAMNDNLPERNQMEVL